MGSVSLSVSEAIGSLLAKHWRNIGQTNARTPHYSSSLGGFA